MTSNHLYNSMGPSAVMSNLVGEHFKFLYILRFTFEVFLIKHVPEENVLMFMLSLAGDQKNR